MFSRCWPQWTLNGVIANGRNEHSAFVHGMNKSELMAVRITIKKYDFIYQLSLCIRHRLMPSMLRYGPAALENNTDDDNERCRSSTNDGWGTSVRHLQFHWSPLAICPMDYSNRRNRCSPFSLRITSFLTWTNNRICYFAAAKKNADNTEALKLRAISFIECHVTMWSISYVHMDDN